MVVEISGVDRVREAAEEGVKVRGSLIALCQNLIVCTQTKKAPEVINLEAVQVKLEETAVDLSQRTQNFKVAILCSLEHLVYSFATHLTDGRGQRGR